jgi:hypothetical protein
MKFQFNFRDCNRSCSDHSLPLCRLRINIFKRRSSTSQQVNISFQRNALLAFP